MNYHTAKMVAEKHGKRCVRDESERCYHFEERDGTHLFTLKNHSLREMTTLGLENRLGVDSGRKESR